MGEHDFVIRGDICYSKDRSSLETVTDGYVVCLAGKSAGVFSRLPGKYRSLPLKDYSNKLVIPGLTDLHIHAPQFSFRALGMDLELLEWLETRAFPEEARYADPEYARRAYRLLTEHVRRGPSTRLVFFATIHTPASLLLMDMLEESGLVCFAGKVNMDRNSPDYLRETDADASLAATREWLTACGKYQNVRPILTPRFVPSCSDMLMKGLAEIQKEYALPLQSHLSENRKEVRWVRELCPDADGYADSYARWDLFGGEVPTIMAHCVWTDEGEMERMAERGVFVAHCPQSNTNLASGIAPVRRFLERGVSVGLGSDVAGGVHTSIFRAMSDAIQVSKLRRVLTSEDGGVGDAHLTLEEAFFLGTAGGGAFFGKTGAPGSFAPGYDFDALVLNDANLAAPFELSIRERLERVVYMSDDRNIAAKYVRGKSLFPADGAEA
ncbi:MAG: amidohydrolase family protein [Spirochaetaceae bacterium]|jgi:guanine deaminase|nr:amidohydrolase family protein [Spirochaetaceae bacterium]